MDEFGNLSLQSPSRNVNAKREDYLDWLEYFMATAVLASKRSKDPSSQVGACIVNKDKKIVGIGYNGMPNGCDDAVFPWSKSEESPINCKYLYVCHAEMNAVMNKNASDVKDCTIYVGLFPCNECAKIIIQSGIKQVVYLSDKHSTKLETVASKRMFDAAGVNYCLVVCTIEMLGRYHHLQLWRDLSIGITGHPMLVEPHGTLIHKRSDNLSKQYKPKHQKIVIDFTEIDWNSSDNNKSPEHD